MDIVAILPDGVNEGETLLDAVIHAAKDVDGVKGVNLLLDPEQPLLSINLRTDDPAEILVDYSSYLSDEMNCSPDLPNKVLRVSKQGEQLTKISDPEGVFISFNDKEINMFIKTCREDKLVVVLDCEEKALVKNMSKLVEDIGNILGPHLSVLSELIQGNV